MMKITTKLIMVLTGVIAMLGAACIIGWWGVFAVKTEMDLLVEQEGSKVDLQMGIQTRMIDVERSVLLYMDDLLFDANPASTKAAIDHVEILLGEIDGLSSQLVALSVTPQEMALLDDFKSEWNAYTKAEANLRSIASIRSNLRAQKVFSGPSSAAYQS